MDMMIENPWIMPEGPSKPLDHKDSYLKGLVDKVATLELRENKHTKEESLRHLREWIQQNPDIENCITGSENNKFRNADLFQFAILMSDVNAAF